MRTTMVAMDLQDQPATPADSLLSQLPGRLRLGTRRSALARTQSQWVADRLSAFLSGLGHQVEVELVDITTRGDVSTAPVSTLGGTGVFVSALRDALLDGRIDFAVHSLKDLPTADADGLTLAALPPREDPRDVLIARDGLTLSQLPSGATVGTGSLRRAAQVRALGLGLEVVDVRGNVDTRLRLVTDGTVDAVVLARAGLARLGRTAEITELFDPLLMLPCPGQGALAVEARFNDLPTIAALALLDDADTRASVLAERSLLARLEAGCSAPIGALAEVVDGEDGPELSLRAVVGSVDGVISIRRSMTVRLSDPDGPVDATDTTGSDTTGSDTTGPAAAAPPDPRTLPAADPTAPPDRPVPARALSAADALIAIELGRTLAEQMLDDGAADLIPVPNSLLVESGIETTAASGTAAMAREGDS